MTTIASAEPIVNAMSVDVEDYFHVSALADVAPRERWDTFESRVVANTERLLELFDEAGIKATFFTLGWVAERYPALVRRVAALGHEVGSHGYAHELVYDLNAAGFREDIRRAKGTIEALTSAEVHGYRAPSYSITTRSLWALDVLVEEGHTYDASIFPIHHDRYGIPNAPRHVHRLHRAPGSLLEVPPSTVRMGRYNFPIAGGGYFRLLPYRYTSWGIRHVNRREGRPVFFYLHPWEVDPDQPRLPASWLSRHRHYHNLHQTETRLVRLMRDFRFAPVRTVIDSALELPYVRARPKSRAYTSIGDEHARNS